MLSSKSRRSRLIRRACRAVADGGPHRQVGDFAQHGQLRLPLERSCESLTRPTSRSQSTASANGRHRQASTTKAMFR